MTKLLDKKQGTRERGGGGKSELIENGYDQSIYIHV